MNRSYFNWIILATLVGIFLVGAFMWQGKSSPTTDSRQEITTRPVSPFRSYISAVGIVEASSENILIGSPVNRVVSKVEVSVGEKVKAGQVLFRLESHDLEADREAKEIASKNATVNLEKLQALPREEDMLVAKASLQAAQVAYTKAQSQYERVDGLEKTGAMSAEDVMQRRFSLQEAEAQLQKAEADFAKVKGGTWLPDLEIAKLKVEMAKADLQRTLTEIQRTIITAPIDATVLQIKIHEGEFPRSPPMIIGNTDILHVRVSINQFDAPFFNREAPAVAYLQGNAESNFPLKFVALEPLFVTKQNITNEITEKVDTRVLQAIYSFKEGTQRVYVGQQMDVFIETKK